MINLDNLVERARELEPLPAATMRLSALVADEDAGLEDIARVVELDPTLTARLLRLANSAANRNGRAIGTVREALMRLGGGAALSLSVAGGVRKTLRRDVPLLGLTAEELWSHSIATSLAAEALRAVSKVPVVPEAFTAALLHDIGKQVLVTALGPEDVDFLTRARSEGQQGEMAAEAELFGVHHAELGGLVAQHWKLSESIVRAITFHHAPDQAGDPMCDVVCVANRVAIECGAAPIKEDLHLPESEGAWARVGLDDRKLERVCDVVRERFGQVKALFA